jgi:hypothetical protein
MVYDFVTTTTNRLKCEEVTDENTRIFAGLSSTTDPQSKYSMYEQEMSCVASKELKLPTLP